MKIESLALESEVLLGYRARERVFAGKYEWVGSVKDIFPIYQRVEPRLWNGRQFELPAIFLQPTTDPPYLYQFR